MKDFLQERHGDGHEGTHSAEHFANLKYGYYIIAISACYILLLVIPHKLQNTNLFRIVRTRSIIVPLWVHIVFWSIISLLFGLYDLDSETITHNVKRFGRISYALVPLDIFLALRPNFINYMNFIDLHKWISRIIIVTALLHSIGFSVHWSLSGEFTTKIVNKWNLIGVLVGFTSLILLFSSLKVVRRYNYKYFYLIHAITYWSFLILITLHARPGVGWYSCIGILFMIYQLYCRYFRSFKIESMDIKEKSGSSLQVISIPKPIGYPSFIAASHIRLNHPWKFYLSTHPYTISSAASDTSIRLVVKRTRNFNLSDRSPIIVSIPYPCFSPNFFENNERTIIFCGGSGISFGLPLLSALATYNSDVELIWCVKNEADLFVLNHFDISRKIKIYITGENQRTKNRENSNDIELESLSSRESLLDSDEFSTVDKSSLEINYGRPDLKTIFEPLQHVQDRNNSWLFACGPNGLISASESWAKENKVLFKSEPYEM